MIKNKRFKHSITLQGEDEIWDSQADVYFRVCGALERLNELNDELGKLTILYSSKCKTEETLIEEGERLEEENKELKAKVDDKEVAVEVECEKLMQKVFEVIDKSLEKDKQDYEMTYEDYLNGRIEVLEELKKELIMND